MKTTKKKNWLGVASALLLMGGVALSTTPLIHQTIVYASESEVTSISTRIKNLPSTENLGEKDGPEVKALMEAYAKLKMADRIKVKDFDTLQEAFDKLVKIGVLSNEDNTILQDQKLLRDKQNKREVSDTTVTEAKEYTFSSQRSYGNSSEQGVSIIIRYTSDADGDGLGDVPNRIVLTAPDGTTYPVTNTSVSMSDGEKLKVDLTWTDLYLQMDFSLYEEGKWTIETSQAVTFTAKKYAGPASDIGAVETTKEEKPKSETKKKTTKKPNRLVPLLTLSAIAIGVGLAIWKFVSVMRAPTAPTVDGDKIPEGAEVKKMSDEEQLAMIKEEYARQKADTGNLTESPTIDQRDLNYSPYNSAPTRRGPLRYDDDDPEETKKDSVPTEEFVDIAMVEEGDTGLLEKDMKPEHLADERHLDETQNTLDGFS